MSSRGAALLTSALGTIGKAGKSRPISSPPPISHNAGDTPHRCLPTGSDGTPRRCTGCTQPDGGEHERHTTEGNITNGTLCLSHPT